MASAAEAAAAKGPLAAAIASGVNTLSLNQTVTFTKYVKMVLPLDGFVFWVKTDLVSQSALFNASLFNGALFDQLPHIVTSAPTISIQGSLHYATARQQNEDETAGVNQVVFTALQEVQDFNQIGPLVVYIAEIGAEGVKFAFSQRQPFYAQADTYHYMGTAVLPAMLSQIIDDPADLNNFDLVVSNSLPIWLSLNGYSPPYPGFQNLGLMLYPSFAVPDNIAPPYGVVHIDPSNTRALQATAWIDATSAHWQLTRDLVKVTLYGLRNTAALTFLDVVIQYSRDTDNIGLMNMPIARDEKRTQAELAILAMKKTIEFEVSYFQAAAREIARQYLTDALTTFTVRCLTSI